MEIEFFNALEAQDQPDPELFATSSCFNAHQTDMFSCYLDAVETHETPLPEVEPPANTMEGVANMPRPWLSRPDWNVIRQYLGWIPIDRCKVTLRNSTQWFRAATQNRLKRHWKSRFPAANVPRWGEDVATDTFFSDVPAGDYGIKGHSGATMMQIYTRYRVSSGNEEPQTC